MTSPPASSSRPAEPATVSAVGATIPGSPQPGASVPPPPPPEVTESERFRLARAARDAALGVSGVVATDPGPDGLFVTLDRARCVEGVICVAAPGEGYDLSLRLMCGLVSLPALGRAVQAQVRSAAARVGVPAASVSVHISEVVYPTAV